MIRTKKELDVLLRSRKPWDEETWKDIDLQSIPVFNGIVRARCRQRRNIWSLAPQVASLIELAWKHRLAPPPPSTGTWWIGSKPGTGFKRLVEDNVGFCSRRKGFMGTDVAEDLAGYAVLHALGEGGW